MAEKVEEKIVEEVSEGLVIKDLGNGYFKLTAKNGVRHIPTQRVYSEVVTKENQINQYEAV